MTTPMKTYFGVMKKDVSYEDLKNNIMASGANILHYYAKFNAIKFETDNELNIATFTDFFESIEPEKDDFTTQTHTL